MGSASAKKLEAKVFAQVAGYRKSLQEEGRADLSGLEAAVRAYCEAIAALPKEEGRRHEEDLQQLMREVTELGEALKAVRDTVHKELSGLNRMKAASVAYHKSDAIGPALRPKQEEE